MALSQRGVDRLDRARPASPAWAVRPGDALGWFARHDRAAAAILLALTLFMFLPGLATLPITDRDESRFVQATRQMHESGNYVDIRFQEEARYKKPVGIYWLQSLATAPFGGAAAPLWAFRIPSLAGAMLAVLGTWMCGRVLFGRETGLIAALLFAPTLVLGVEAHLAKTDAVLLACIVAAQAVLARAWLGFHAAGPGGASAATVALPWPAAILFWAAVGAGILVKGPILPLVTGATILGLSLSARSGRWLLALRPAAGVPIALAVVLPWLAAIAFISDGAFFRDAVGRDFLAKLVQGQEQHGAPPGAYLLAFFLTGWPMAALAPLAAPFVLRNRRDPAVLFCVMWLIPAWLVFEAAATKLLHYTLPLYPAVALLVAAALARGEIHLARWWRKAVALLLPLVPFMVAAAIVGLAFVLPDRLSAPGLALALCSTIAGGLAWHSLSQRQVRRAIVAAVLSATFLYSGVYSFVLPGLRSVWMSPQIVFAAAEASGCGKPALAASGYHEPSLVVAAGTSTFFGGPEQVAAWLQPGGCRIAVVEEGGRDRFLAHAATLGLKPEEVGLVEGFNYSGGDPVRLSLYRPQPAA